MAGSLAGPTWTLPPGEVGLDAEGGHVLAMEPGPPATLVIRELTTGDFVAAVATDLTIDNGLLQDGRIYVSARSADGAQDGGVWQATVGETALQSLIPAVAGAPENPGLETRGPLALSPSSATLASTVCTTISGCSTQIADVASGTVTTLGDRYIRWVSDAYAIVNERPHLRSYGLDDLQLRWETGDEVSDPEFWDSYFLADGVTLVLSAREDSGDGTRHYQIAHLDVESGARQTIATFTGPEAEYQLVADLSTDHYAVILEAFFVDIGIRDHANYRVLDLTTGQLLPTAFPLTGDLK
jgi:hypothetical protein